MRSEFLCFLVVMAPMSLLAIGQDSKRESVPANGGDFSNVTDASSANKSPDRRHPGQGSVVERERLRHAGAGRRERRQQCL